MNRKNNIRRKNAKLYPIYKMFSYDFLFFYSIEFLFYVMVKKITASEVLLISGLYFFFEVVMQIPAVAITDFLGKKKSIILGNILIVLHTIILLIFPGAISIIFANLMSSFGFCIKTIAEPNLLYDSVSTKGGDGLYSKLEARGDSWYYILDGIASLVAGYLFVINGYIPIVVCLLFSIISLLLSLGFKDIYEVKQKGKMQLSTTLKEYGGNLKESFKFIIKSRRMKALILFQIVFYGFIRIIETYRSDLLVNMGIPEEQFSMIFAVLTLISGVSISLRKPIENKFKNRTLSFLSLTFIFSCLIIGIITMIYGNNKSIIPLILIMYAIQKTITSIWYVLETKYLKNFSTENMRNKLSFTYEFIGSISASIASIMGGILLDIVDIKNAFLLSSLLALALMIIVLDYMRTRFGLRPEQYKKEDIEFNSND